MPTHHQLKVEPPVRVYGMGSCDTADLRVLYPGSPVYDGTLTDAITVAIYETENTAPVLNDGGHTFGSVNRDYQDAPNLEEVVVGGAGLPGSPYGPNIAVPPSDPFNPSGIPAAGAGVVPIGGGGAGVGDGLLSPDKPSKKLGQRNLGSLIFGKSGAV